MTGTPEPAVGLLEDGERLWRKQLAAATDGDFAGPSRLPGWDRAHLVAHLAGNAKALLNLITWAGTGVETPMYPDPQFRARQIDELAALPPGELRDRCERASDELMAAWRALPEAAWGARVRSAQGRDIPVAEICWMRARENHIHAVDLGMGLEFADLPLAFLEPLLDDVAGGLTAKGAPSVTLIDSSRGRSWQIGETPGSVTVQGTTAALAQWATGRGDPMSLASLTSTSGALPPLPPWL